MSQKDYYWKIKNFISDTELGFSLITRTVCENKELLVNRKTDLVVEGYPRSANTFCVAAIQYMQASPIKIARHRHELGQIILGIKYNLPILILIRDPKDAIPSFIIREKVGIKFAFKYYIKYYSFIIKNLNSFVVADFTETINNTDLIVKYINNKFITNLSHFKLTNNDIIKIKKNVVEMEKQYDKYDSAKPTHIALPTKERRAMKNTILKEIERNFSTNLQISKDLYNKILINR